ncbi:DNA translocase FtsK 4TM domain-containing protein [Cognatishimia sp. SS12]|uniref:DNA translocase FtsK n=1 Tax=Cognatishimia sp. SS12 TaxID=2979465 RepID=UPI00232AB153|nr:DNA translocase FtsK [Cognatishimia sp. SS12]MDC0737932.1 DNA translocase FtsK 4TM domain-containing protein [Cognatishimia sp. SS12]
MAYQARGRDPLLDSDTQAALEKRGKELIGIVLILLGLMAAAMIISYTPDDPNWMSATDAPVQNWMGRLGASISAPLFMIVGWGSWGVALVALAWGLRFALHRGEDSALSRVIFAPIVLALGSVYAATLVPGDSWTHSFGLGGLFGDTVLGAILTILPIGAVLGLKIMSFLMGLGVLALTLFVMGFTRPELSWVGRFLLIGVIMTYANLMTLLGRGATGAVSAAQSLQAKRRERRAVAAEMPQPAEASAQTYAAAQDYADAYADPDPVLEEPTKPTLLSRVPALIKRSEPVQEPMPEPELVEHHLEADDREMPGDDRIKAKIADVIKSRVRSNKPTYAPDIAPVTKGLGRGPSPLVLQPGGTPQMRNEPPLTADMASAAPYDDAAPFIEAEEEPIEAAEVVPMQPAPQAPVAEPSPVPAQAPRAPAPQIPVAEPRKVVQHSPRKAVEPSARARAEAEPQLAFDPAAAEYELPPLNLLTSPQSIERYVLSDEALEENARMLEAVLDDYGVKGEIVSVRPGPVVTMYELEPAPGLKASRVIGLADDIARSMSALSARVSTVPGRSVIGIELPNEKREMVAFREILSSREYESSNRKLPLALGKDIGGDPIVANLAKMPHLLIAGTTGSGKSVAINTMILSLLYKLTPDDCRMIMIDPKMLELSVYDGIPHLLSPVVTDPKKAVVALKWTVGEMEDRYRKMSKMGVRNIDGYNSRVADALAKGETFSRTVQTGFDDETGEPVFETEEIIPEKMPYIVVVVDEMADLMMVAGKEIEACIQRLAQMARASGIHIIMATQRPSVDVITGTIKANFPTRISFQVTSKVDSRTILGEMGAEQLLGMGDMLYMAGGAKITRCHGPFVSDEEVEEVVNHLKSFGPPEYVGGVIDGPKDDKADNIDAVLGLGGNTNGEDALYDQAVAIVIKDRKCSTSYIQRKLAIGYNKAARLVEQMEDEGVVSSANHVGKREILVPEQ